MKQIEFKTEKGEFVVVDVPHECHVSDISIGSRLNDVAIGYPDGTFKPIGIMPCILICKLSECTEVDAKGVVGSRFTGGGLKSRKREESYKDYINGGYPRGVTSFYSLKTLLKSKGIDINSGNWYLFKKV